MSKLYAEMTPKEKASALLLIAEQNNLERYTQFLQQSVLEPEEFETALGLYHAVALVGALNNYADVTDLLKILGEPALDKYLRSPWLTPSMVEKLVAGIGQIADQEMEEYADIPAIEILCHDSIVSAIRTEIGSSAVKRTVGLLVLNLYQKLFGCSNVESEDVIRLAPLLRKWDFLLKLDVVAENAVFWMVDVLGATLLEDYSEDTLSLVAATVKALDELVGKQRVAFLFHHHTAGGRLYHGLRDAGLLEDFQRSGTPIPPVAENLGAHSEQ